MTVGERYSARKGQTGGGEGDDDEGTGLSGSGMAAVRSPQSPSPPVATRPNKGRALSGLGARAPLQVQRIVTCGREPADESQRLRSLRLFERGEAETSLNPRRLRLKKRT